MSATTGDAKHGLAASIRACTESETFDLGGAAVNIEGIIEQAFQEEFPLNDMIRITLVVGAGKQARQKYDPQAIRKVTSTLQQLGFQEDRGASCILQCAGTFKSQHDTGKNLKTVVVFPRVAGPGGAGGGGSNSTAKRGGGASSSTNDDYYLPPDSLEYKVAICSHKVFESMVQTKFPTWSEKKALQQLMDDKIVSKLQHCEDLMMKGQPFGSKHQEEFYESICVDIPSKVSYLKQSLQSMVQKSQLTSYEIQSMLLPQIQQRIQDLQEQGKPIPKPLLERQEKVKTMTPNNDLPKLKHYAELVKLWKQVQPVLHIQESTGGTLLSVQDTKLLGQKQELLDEIHRLEQDSRGLLETDAHFEQRIQNYQKELQQKYKLKLSAKSSGGGGGKSKK